MYTKKTKIVATIGPATSSEKMLEKLFKAGVNVVRLNFSHGDFAEHLPKLERTRELSHKLGMPIAVLQDLSGPKIRTGDLANGQTTATLKEGRTLILTTETCSGDEERMYVNYEKLPQEVKKGNIIFLDDGRRKLEVVSISGNEIKCLIKVGGPIKARRGVNVPGAYLSISSLTDKDRKDLLFGVKNKVDFMAFSFVRRASDVLELKSILKKLKAENIGVIPKIETQEAVDNIDEIIAVSDGIMVARGDLAIEIPAEHVPVVQKEIVKKCNKVGIPVIVATQMLESMIHSPVPTRAEVNDVANAIFDGTDAVMLSEETTLGEYPVQAVEMMARIATQVEKSLDHEGLLQDEHLSVKTTTDSFSYASLNMAHEIKASAIVALSISGFTARMISRYKPHSPLIVLTPEKRTYNQLALSFGCYAVICPQFGSMLDLIGLTRKMLAQKKLAKKGDTVLIVAGLPFGHSGGTNVLTALKV